MTHTEDNEEMDGTITDMDDALLRLAEKLERGQTSVADAAQLIREMHAFEYSQYVKGWNACRDYVEPPREAPEDLLRYDDADENVNISEIIVPTERDKAQLLLACRYLHDSRDIDTDFMAVNTLAHCYHVPELIKVRAK